MGRCVGTAGVLIAVFLGLPAPPAEAAERDAAGGRDHWAFQPIRRPRPPEVTNRSWVRTPVDAFILARLEQAGLEPAGAADHAALFRRVTYDLTGLPPSRAEVEAFLADPSDDAYARWVDRLLDSPRFGEQWGRHWLDLVRYAETNSFERDSAKPHVWRYRDYVIRSFQEDKPFDRFVLEQLAGDELEPVLAEALVATGYYRLGPWDDEPADPLLAEYDELDDVLTTTSQVFLGLTVNCARCHDHKLDPIPQRDYYSLLAYFRNLRRYGDRTADSVNGASVRVIAGPDERERHRREVGEHERAVALVRARMGEIEALVLPDLSPVEHEEFRHEQARPALLQARVGSLLDAETAAEYGALREELREREAHPPAALAQALCVSERGAEAPPTHVLLRGNPHVPGDEVAPAPPGVLGAGGPAIVPPAHGKSTGRRLALARWIVDPANPLTARVLVNRLWQYHFGEGLVATSNDFGLQGARPTHPELLDWLASEIVERGWSMKALHRVILLSSTYRMSATPAPAALAPDADNALLSRFRMRRLTAEEVRDSILAVNGTLNLQAFGPSVYPEMPPEVLAGQSRPGEGWGRSTADQEARRSLYVHVKRSLALPLLAAFDAADTDFTCPVRFATSQPTQALTLLNSAFIQEQARRFAMDLLGAGDDAAAREVCVREALWRVTQRPPRAAEVARGLRLIEELVADDGAAEPVAVQTFCLLALNLNEFLHLE